MEHLLMTGLTALSFPTVNARETKTYSFKVFGNCGMCEQRIENAAKKAGVTKAEWNHETQRITIVYDPAKTTLEKVHKAIAAVGHDTVNEKAPDAVYNKLHGCCRYARKTGSVSNN